MTLNRKKNKIAKSSKLTKLSKSSKLSNPNTKQNSKVKNSVSSYKINRENGIYDINGIYPNPLTNESYKNIYSNETIKLSTEPKPVSSTYSNLLKYISDKIVYLNKDKIIETISQNQVILLTAGTGVGKTVLVPRIALHVFNYGEKVLCTIPKRMSTFLTADFVSKCLDSKLGEHVGYYYQGTNQVNKNGIESKLIFTTTGSLISSMTGADPLLSDYKCIIVDEAHERSVQTDQLLLLLKRACIKRPDLKIIIMSATIDLDRFRDYYPASQFQFGEVDGGSELSFPITDFWMDKKPTNWMEKTIEYTMKILKSTPSGDIMIFVKSGGDGNRLCGMLETAMALYRKELTVKLTNMNSKQTLEDIKKAIYAINPICIKLEAKSTKEEQNLAKEEYLYKSLKDSHGNPYTRKIVITTNVAESSITINGIVYVIDSGYEYTDAYEPNARVRSLLENTIAQSAVKQRKGRAGRTQKGYCIHLYSENEFKHFEKFPIPSIEKTDITNDILDLMKLPGAEKVKGVRELLDEFISPPHEKFIINSLKTLYALNAITNITNDGEITHMGYALSRFRSIKVNYARAIIASHFYGVSRSVCDLVALITIADGMLNSFIYEFYPDKKKSKETNQKEEQRYKKLIKSYAHPMGDFMTLLNIYKQFRKVSEHLSDFTNADDNIVDDIANSDDIILSENESINSKVKLNSKQEKQLITARKWCKEHYLNFNKLKKVSRASKQLYETLFKLMRPLQKHINKQPNKTRRQSKKINKNDIDNFIAVDTVMDDIEPELPPEAIKHQRETNRIMSKVYKSKTQTIHTGGYLKQIKEQEKMEKLEPFPVKRFQTEDENIMMCMAIGNFINIAIKSSKQNNDVYVSCFAQNKKFARISRDSFLIKPGKLIMYDEMFMSSQDAKFMKLNLVNNLPEKIFQRIKELYGGHIKYCI